MSNIIDSIKLSGTVYTLSAQTSGGGGNPTVELTQAEYDALVTAGTVSADTYYIITDAQAWDLTQYWTSAQTQSAITEATSGKANSSDVYLKTETSGATELSTAFGNKQDTLVSGSNIKTINNESILGSGNITIQGTGGGKAISAGTNISVTTGETADTVSCTLPITAYINETKGDISIGTKLTGATYAYGNILLGRRIQSVGGSTFHKYNIGIGMNESTNSEVCNTLFGKNNVAIGCGFNIGTSSNVRNNNCVVIGNGASSKIDNGVAIGIGALASGTTKTNINNQLTIDTSNQVYIYNKDNTEMICLQDNLGGGGGITSGEVQTMIDESVSGKVDTSSLVTAVTSASTDSEIPTAKAVYNAIPTGGTDTYISGVTIVDNSAPSIPTNKVRITWEDGYTETKDISESFGDGVQHGYSNMTKFEFGNMSNPSDIYYNYTVGGDNCYDLSSVTFVGDVVLDNYFGSAFNLQEVYFYADSPSGFTYRYGAVDVDFLDTVYDGCETYETTAATYPIYVANLANYQNATLVIDGGNTTWGEHFGNRLQEIPNLGKNIAFSYNTDKEDITLPVTAITDGVSIEVSSAITSGDTNAVAGGAVYDKFDEVEQVTARALNELSEGQEVTARALIDVNDKFDGMRLLKITQSGYDALSGNTDSNTLYIIVN